jgi:predicted RNA-binding protein with TRAM domain
MEVDGSIVTLFHAQLSEFEETPVIKIPEQEVETGPIDDETTYRIAVIEDSCIMESESDSKSDPLSEISGSRTEPRPERQGGPPVSEGERCKVTIEGVGEEGDGMAKIDGYTVFVPESEVNETLQVEIVKVRPNFAFAEPINTSRRGDSIS